MGLGCQTAGCRPLAFAPSSLHDPRFFPRPAALRRTSWSRGQQGHGTFHRGIIRQHRLEQEPQPVLDTCRSHPTAAPPLLGSVKSSHLLLPPSFARPRTGDLNSFDWCVTWVSLHNFTFLLPPSPQATSSDLCIPEAADLPVTFPLESRLGLQILLNSCFHGLVP